MRKLKEPSLDQARWMLTGQELHELGPHQISQLLPAVALESCAAPSLTAGQWQQPACVANCIASEPGSSMQKDNALRNYCSDSQLRSSTTSLARLSARQEQISGELSSHRLIFCLESNDANRQAVALRLRMIGDGKARLRAQASVYGERQRHPSRQDII